MTPDVSKCSAAEVTSFARFFPSHRQPEVVDINCLEPGPRVGYFALLTEHSLRPWLKVNYGMLSAPASRKLMSYRMAGIDIHKKMLAVVVADVEIDGENQFERAGFGATPSICGYWRNG